VNYEYLKKKWLALQRPIFKRHPDIELRKITSNFHSIGGLQVAWATFYSKARELTTEPDFSVKILFYDQLDNHEVI